MTSQTTIHAPQITEESAPFWAAANEGYLLLRRCLDTGRPYYYPRDHSPFTGSKNTDWMVASGAGTIYSFSFSLRENLTHCIAYITLDEGPIILSNVYTDSPQRIRIGQRVKVDFVSNGGEQKIPVFRPDLSS